MFRSHSSHVVKMNLKLLLFVLFCFSGLGQAEIKPVKEEATKEWFPGARFGMFIHWGVYAVPAGVWDGKDIPGIGEWIMKNAKIPVAPYRALARDFTASSYDPKSWAALAREAGMKYVVITSKHHDGFALYDSAVTDWDVASSAAKRDLLLPLAEAVRREGLKFGLYYSQSQDWVHPGGRKSGILEGQPGWDPAQNGSFDDYLAQIALPQTREIFERYRPDVVWWDTPGAEMTPARVQPFLEEIRKRPGLISNNRLGGGFEGDTMTPEQHIPPRGYPGKMFEVCMTMNNTWGFKTKDQNWKSTQQLLRNLSDISSKGGNFLLNVGPDAEGRIPAASVERLQQIGRWMKTHGEAIHGTSSSPFPRRLPWGRVTRRIQGSGEVLYLHVWERPQDGVLLLPQLDQEPLRAESLERSGPVSTKKTPEGIEVRFSEPSSDELLPIVKLEFSKPIRLPEASLPSPGPDGKLRLTVWDADCLGHYDGNIQTMGKGEEAYLGNWKNPKYSVEYQVSNSVVGSWQVRAEVSAEKESALLLGVGKEKSPAKITPTQGGWVWQDLGKVQLPAGTSTLAFQPSTNGWSEIRLRRVELNPAPKD